MGAPKNHAKAGGRKAGVPNKMTRTVKETLQYAFEMMQTKPKVNLVEWGEKNPTDFYKLVQKLIPQAIDATISGTDGGPIKNEMTVRFVSGSD